MIRRLIQPRKVISWNEFIQTHPAFSIAIDGYVKGEPRYDQTGPRLNLNHHEEVDRFATRSTSGQLFVNIKQGLFNKFRSNDEAEATLYLNDPDQDGCLTDWMTRNHQRFTGFKSEPLINKLIWAEDMLDATAGAYPLPLESDLMRDLSWIFEPYTSQITRMPELDAKGMEGIIEAVGSRIDRYVLGKGEKLSPDARFEMLHQENEWAMVKEIGPYARSGLYGSGNLGFIAFRGESPKGHYRYALGSMSHYVGFEVPFLIDEFNKVEGISPDNPDRWGGGTTTGGSPRESGSKMNPGQLAAVATESLKKRKQAA